MLGSSSATSTNIANPNLDPTEATNAEVGTKWDLFGGRVSLTSAIYRLEKDNARTTNPLSGLTTLSGKQRTDGFELGLAGALTSQWNVSTLSPAR